MELLRVLGQLYAFGFGNQFQKLGYRTLAYHDYLYTYYDRNLSHPNMGYEYYGIGNGLELEQVQPPSDREMMEEIVPQFVKEDQFMVYILTVSGHLNYTREENAQADRHYDEVADLPYSEAVKCYLASQMELELAMESLMDQLGGGGQAGRHGDRPLRRPPTPTASPTRSTASCSATRWTRSLRSMKIP